MSIKRYLPGIVLVLLIALFSYFLSNFNESFDALVISIMVGMFAGNVFVRPCAVLDGIEAAHHTLLPAGIALYGAQLAFNEIQGTTLGLVLVVFTGLFGLTLLISRVFNLNRQLSVLLASGLSVCGAAAIASIAPLIGARREDTSIAIISVMTLGLTGMIFYPLIHNIFSLTGNEFEFLAGATLPMIGQVKVAAGSVSAAAIDHAVKIKLVRVSFLLFVVTASVLLSGKGKKGVSVPWFVVIFIAMAAIVNTTKFLVPYLEQLKSASSFFLSAGLAAIGYSVDFDAIIDEGITPVGVLFLSWGAVILLMYLVRNLF
ncbi:MAG: putative sulfate exporter family transporter [Nitrospiraceae bacterium]|nr:putative sulfate exporter family transporter [Nitrospiraceae bacterium]